VWDASLKWASNPGRDVRIQGQAYAGTAQSTGDDPRLVLRSGVDGTAWWHETALRLVARFDDYGPYDYYRTFNLTFPFQALADLATRAGREGHGARLWAPLVRWSKTEIVREALRLGVPIATTWSCYSGDDHPCGVCDSCRIRDAALLEAGRADLTSDRSR
jgi:7-cyano-7-deazaguanine synthase in queuosine biosynthesis